MIVILVDFCVKLEVNGMLLLGSCFILVLKMGFLFDIWKFVFCFFNVFFGFRNFEVCFDGIKNVCFDVFFML